MPTFDYACQDCGRVHEEFHRMSETPQIICLICGGTCKKVPVLGQFIYPADATWHADNQGKGKYISGLGRRTDPSAYAKSLTDAQEKAKSKGLSYELT